MRVLNALEEYEYLSDVAEYWGTRDHACQKELGFLCSACQSFYGDLEAASIALDNAVAASIAGPRPEWVKPWWLNPERAFA